MGGHECSPAHTKVSLCTKLEAGGAACLIYIDYLIISISPPLLPTLMFRRTIY